MRKYKCAVKKKNEEKSNAVCAREKIMSFLMCDDDSSIKRE